MQCIKHYIKYENIKFNHIIVDGNRFKTFVTKDGFINTCVVKGDSKYLNIAAWYISKNLS